MSPNEGLIQIFNVCGRFQTGESKKWLSVRIALNRGPWLKHHNHSESLALSVTSKSILNCNRRIYKTIKYQISSTKLQINLKFQYSMTKTFTTVVLIDLPMMMPLSTTVDGSFWNFEFRSLGFV